MSKKAYTTWSSQAKAHIAEHHGDIEATIACATPNESYSDAIATIFEAELRVLEGKAKHIFMPSREFCDWLVGCVKELDPKYLTLIHENLSNPTAKEQDDRHPPLMIHFPTDCHRPSFVFFATADSRPDKTEYRWLSMSFSKECRLGCVCVEADDEWLTGWEQFNQKDVTWYAKLAVGLGMYLAAFPETLIKGLPDDLKHPAHHQHRDVICVAIDRRVCLGGTHDSPTPHFRQGHFRVLRNECFTRKRYQSVFVSATFVKGTAQTVLSPEQVLVEA